MPSNVFAQEEITAYDSHGKRDPFWQLVTPSGAIVSYETDLLASDMVLEGIISDEEGFKCAIINGFIVKPKDKIGLFVIEAVGKDEVILKKGEEVFALRLKGGKLYE